MSIDYVSDSETRRTGKWLKFTALALLVLALLLLAAIPFTTYFWDGGFPQLEYQLNFLDREGRPIEGIELQVVDEAGNEFLYYPVTDLCRATPLASNTAGELTFHHVREGGFEFGGRCADLWLIRLGTCDSPRYLCRFLREGEEVFSCNFSDLHRAMYSSAKRPDEVTRKWNWQAYFDERFGDDDTDAVQERLYLRRQAPVAATSRELSVWSRAAVQALYRRDTLGKPDSPAAEELSFRICRRTIHLD